MSGLPEILDWCIDELDSLKKKTTYTDFRAYLVKRFRQDGRSTLDHILGNQMEKFNRTLKVLIESHNIEIDEKNEMS